VLDANVIISGLIRPQGPPGQILLRLLREQAFELIASSQTLEELRRSLRYPRVRKYLPMTTTTADVWVDALTTVAVIVEGKVTRHVVSSDPADDVYLAAAVEGLADCIVSGDRHLLDLAVHDGILIVSPRTFLSLDS
jgi:putative PIN family toxin of toxin-antitoxin system